MHYYLIAPTIIIRKDKDVFTYHSLEKLALGLIVQISIGKKEAIGVIISSVDKPDFITKPILRIFTSTPLPKSLLKTAQWLSDYYVTPLPLVWQTILPTGLHKKRRQAESQSLDIPVRNRTTIVLNHEQQCALELINSSSFNTGLLHGVTGSGKTHVYIEAAKYQQSIGRSSIVLVPEISLTPQLTAEFTQHFKDVVVTHSKMTESDRHRVWLQILVSQDPIIVIGPRSALFMPVNNLGLIVIDECHESSFKQDQSPKYSALRAASMLARFTSQAKVIFGSATPSIADLYTAQSKGAPVLELTKTAIATSPPSTTLIDCKKRDNFREHRFISDKLLSTIRQSLADKKQTIIFHNRRGTAPSTICTSCGWTALCINCFVPLILHADKQILVCHQCNSQKIVPPNCPECHNPDITFKGIGTKLVEDSLKRLFPKARTVRFDADNEQSQTLSSQYQDLYDGKFDIIIGTQLLAKGLDLPNLATVGVIQADNGIQLPDYQAHERVFQLLYQIAGRVGRNENRSSVIIQTYQPDNYVIQLALNRDYDAFYQQEIVKRQTTHFPPFTYLLKLVCTYKTEAGAIRSAQRMSNSIKKSWLNVTVLGPAPAFYERLGGAYRWQLLIKSNQRSRLVEICRSLPNNWQADIDPSSIL